MTVTGIDGVHARVAAIEQRFAPAFAPALQAAGHSGTASTAAGRSAVAASAGTAATRFSMDAATRANTTQHADAPSGDWAAGLPEGARQWAGAIEDAANRAGIEPQLLASLVWAESGFRANATSHAGAIGLAQLMPATARGLGVNPHDPLENLDGGARYLAEQIDRFGRVDHALAAYNAGPGRVAQAGGIPSIPETQAYVTRVLGYYGSLGGSR